jgi:hypothetical protein
MNVLTEDLDGQELMLSRPEAGHALGPVADDWEAAEVWLAAVARKSSNGSTATRCQPGCSARPSGWRHRSHSFVDLLCLCERPEFARGATDVPVEALPRHHEAASNRSRGQAREQPRQSRGLRRRGQSGSQRQPFPVFLLEGGPTALGHE